MSESSPDSIEDYFLKQGERLGLAVEREENHFYLANKTFYTTCHKISRQNNPNFKKKPPYTLLESWLIHSVFSKSQQILLRFPSVYPRVMMTEGDFIYTPHQVVESPFQQEAVEGYEDDEEDDYYDDDTFVIGEEGVIMMSASAPIRYIDEDENEPVSVMMDENTWMGHSKYNGNGLTLHVVNPDLDGKEEGVPQNCDGILTVGEGKVAVGERNEVDENRLDVESKFVSMSPELIDRYRSASLASTTNNAYNESSGSEIAKANIGESEKYLSRHLNSSYQSLADMMLDDDTENHLIYSQQINTVSYGSLQEQRASKKRFMLQVSSNSASITQRALDLAQHYQANEEKTFINLVSYIFNIWISFVLGVGTLLDWRSHVKSPSIV
ncbi:hypothetical protein BY458DRAFT_507388 [Sporodiniella umbellata]|nr:hypothetical protein BY458DRAFT_507388 [Sporodiniella umbellata]